MEDYKLTLHPPDCKLNFCWCKQPVFPVSELIRKSWEEDDGDHSYKQSHGTFDDVEPSPRISPCALQGKIFLYSICNKTAKGARDGSRAIVYSFESVSKGCTK